MFEIQNYGGFITAIIVFQLFPGAGTVMILNATARKGIYAGLSAVLGTLIGDFTYMLAAVLGLAAALNAYPGILPRVQWIGVAYLCWIGWKLLRAPVVEHLTDSSFDRAGWTYLRQALAVSLTNPKVIMFFMALFPLFLDQSSRPITFFILMMHVTVISFIFQAGLVLVGNTIARRLSRWQYARLFATRLAGVALIGFGIELALNNR